jgi:octaprenyl-diphosphate synthase
MIYSAWNAENPKLYISLDRGSKVGCAILDEGGEGTVQGFSDLHALHANWPFSLQLNDIRSLIAEDLRAVDALIARRLDSQVVLVRQIADYIIAAGGKRLRPALVVLAARSLGYQGQAHHELAAVVEFIHTATLLHDDIVDESDMRRGRKTANSRFGNAPAVLVGDFLYSRSFQMMVSVADMSVMSVLADATNVIAEGEVLQLINAGNADIDEEAYLDVLRRKTAKLFEAAARIGAIVAGGTEQQRDFLARYGMRLGTAFQLVDDALDYSGDAEELGKSPGDDLREGKPTLPLIRAMKVGTRAQADLIRASIENGARGDFAKVMDVVVATDALQYTRERARKEAASALEGIECLPDTRFRAALRDLADFSVERVY